MGRMSASYGQFCPIAKASEIFATRWTPLIVREVMTGVHSFNDIHRGVPLISRAVLVARLRELEDHGVIERRPRGDGAGHEYWLTPAGDQSNVTRMKATRGPSCRCSANAPCRFDQSMAVRWKVWGPSGDSAYARIGVMRALNRHVGRVFNPDRKDHYWGRRKAGDAKLCF